MSRFQMTPEDVRLLNTLAVIGFLAAASLLLLGLFAILSRWGLRRRKLTRKRHRHAAISIEPRASLGQSTTDALVPRWSDASVSDERALKVVIDSENDDRLHDSKAS